MWKVHVVRLGKNLKFKKDEKVLLHILTRCKKIYIQNLTRFKNLFSKLCLLMKH